MDETFLPFAHFFAVPAAHGVLIDRQRFIGHHQILAHAQHLPESFAARAGTIRIVEVEHQVAGLAEFYSVGGEFFRKQMLMHPVGAPYFYDGLVVAFEICGFD